VTFSGIIIYVTIKVCNSGLVIESIVISYINGEFKL
jgi:hypothetical protein